MEDGRWKPERESVERGSPASPTEGRGGAMVRRSTLHAHMTVLPVIERELRMRARQGVTYWTRCGVAAMAAMVGLQELVLSASAVSPASLGAAAFRAVGWLGFLVTCGSALATAASISRERRDGTLGLLLLTQLRGYDVVLGKLCAAGLTDCYALVGVLPALGLVALAGGVSGGQFVRTSP